MTIYTQGTIGFGNGTVNELPTTLGQSAYAAAQEAWAGNPAPLIGDSEEFSLANRGESLFNSDPMGASYNIQRLFTAPPTKLLKVDVEQQAQAAGVKLPVPEEGLSQAAVNILIARRQEQQRREDVLSRAPDTALGTTTRFLAQLGAGIADPLNIASAFVPVVGEARVALMLGRTSGVLGRAGVRTGVGVVEGAAGQAMLEPLLLLGHTQLHDDYTMADSLENIAFGGILGGGLHVTGGAIADKLRLKDIKPLATLDDLPKHSVKTIVDFDTGKMSVDDFSILYKQDPDAAKQLIAQRFGDRPALDDAPFAKASLDSIKFQAMDELTPQLKAELLADAGNVAEKGAIALLKTQQQALLKELEIIKANPDATFKQYAKSAQERGLSRKQAETQARQQIDDRTAGLISQTEAINQKIETNTKASSAAQQLKEIESGKIPERFQARVAQRVDEIAGQRRLQEALAPGNAARYTVALASPESRQAALSSAIAQAVEGNYPDVDALIRANPNEPNSINAIKQIKPESMTSDPKAATAAAERLNTAPKTMDLASAEAAMAKAMERLQAVQKNLEQGGLAIEKGALKLFDEAVKRSEDYGNAVRAAALCGVRA